MIQLALIERYWHPIAFRRELELPNSYVCTELGLGVEIAACRPYGSDRIVVFDNRCPHRGARIFDQGAGVGSLACRYHGLAYSAALNCMMAPAAVGIKDDSAPLREMAVEWCGDLLFAAIAPDCGLHQQLGADLYQRLGDISARVGARHSHAFQNWNAPWMVAIENAIEATHVPLVHRETLGALDLREPEHRRHGINSVYSAEVANCEALERLPFHDNCAAPGEYVSWYLFPCSQLSTTFGYAFSLNRWTLQPDAPDSRCRLETRIYEGAAKMTSAAGRAYLEAARAMDDRIFAEDAQMVARVPDVQTSRLGSGEPQIGWFREALGRVDLLRRTARDARPRPS